MKLSFKDIKLIIEAIENLINTYEERLNSENIDEDKVSDMGNDCMFLEALREDLAKSLKHNKLDTHVSSSSNLPSLSVQELMQRVLQLPINQRLALVDAITQSIRQELSFK
jgi:hypothetical protein